MSKVTAVESQKKNPKKFNVFLDGVFAFGADEDLVVGQRLVVGKAFTTSDVERLLFESEVGKLMERMYALFNIRQRSEQEVRRYLKNLSFKRKIKDQEEISESAIELLINKLKQKRLLSDAEFAKAWMESRAKKYGVNRIKQELYKKGIDRQLIEEVISGERMENSEQVARKLLEKKLERWKSLTPMELKKKAFDFLLRRGFEYSQVKSIIENILKKG